MTYRIVFAGTPEFAVPSLSLLGRTSADVAAVLTQPDRPAGRGRRLTASPIKRLATELGIPVYQPSTLRHWTTELSALNPDLVVVAAYGLLLPVDFLNVPRLGCINVHASLLPRWRGAAPVQRAIEAGDTTTGISLMQMDQGLDTGDILAQAEIPISPEETGGSLHDKLANLGAEVLGDSLPTLEALQRSARQQSTQGLTYARKVEKSESRIDWEAPAAEIERRIRAFNPWPSCHAIHEEERIIIRRAAVTKSSRKAKPGTIWVSENHIEVSTGAGGLRLLEVQTPGRKPLPAAEFLNGHALLTGTVLS